MNKIRENIIIIIAILFFVIIVYTLFFTDYSRNVVTTYFTNGKEVHKMAYFYKESSLFTQTDNGVYTICGISEREFNNLRFEKDENTLLKKLKEMNEDKFCEDGYSFVKRQFGFLRELMRQLGNMNSILGLVFGTSKNTEWKFTTSR